MISWLGRQIGIFWIHLFQVSTAFLQNSILEGAEADIIKREYLEICEDQTVAEYLKNYKMMKNTGSDDFISKINDFYQLRSELENFFKMVFIFFPSNVEVERGFAVNKECIVENLANDFLIAQRLVYDWGKHPNVDHVFRGRPRDEIHSSIFKKSSKYPYLNRYALFQFIFSFPSAINTWIHFFFIFTLIFSLILTN